MVYNRLTVMSEESAEEILIAVLLEAGAHGTQVDGGSMPDVSSFDYVDEKDLPVVPYQVSAYFPVTEDIVAVAEKVRYVLDNARNDNPEIDFGSLEISFASVKEEDWANEWKKYFKPAKVADRTVVCPSWEQYSPSDNDVVISLDPGMAFGTGTHETTRMCIGLLEKYVNKGSSVLDIGCGSGILSIVSAKLGADTVLGVDLDPVAVKVSLENCEINEVCQVVSVIKSDITTEVSRDKKYDVVVANIIADIVIRLTDTVTDFMKEDGIYITSGIIDTRVDDVRQSLLENGFDVIDVLEMNDWRAIAARKRK